MHSNCHFNQKSAFKMSVFSLNFSVYGISLFADDHKKISLAPEKECCRYSHLGRELD